MADIICRWRNGAPKTVVELVNSLPHDRISNEAFRDYMNRSKWGTDFFRTPYQLACQLGLYYESDDGYYYPRFNHDINESEATDYLKFWLARYYVPNPYVRKDGFNNIPCPTYVLKSLYDYVVIHPNCDYDIAYSEVFKEKAANNIDIVCNYINSSSDVLRIAKDHKMNITGKDPQKTFDFMNRDSKKEFFENFNDINSDNNAINASLIANRADSKYQDTLSYLTALRTKPFMLLAGISGTGKSRIVRKLAQATVTETLQKKYDREYAGTDFNRDRWRLHAPANFQIIQVKPNWHNSMDVLGYLSNIPSPHYVLTPFVNFIVKAWINPDVPFFLCLDEMNLAPVEEYFAEFLSAIESRSFEKGEYITDPIIKPFNEFGNEIANGMIEELLQDTTETPIREKIKGHLCNRGLTLPENLMVIGTVNMDETTFSFSRKVLDRAMSIEMNEVDYECYLGGNTDDGIKAIVNAFDNCEYKDANGDGPTLNELLINRHIAASEVIQSLGGSAEGSDARFVIDYLNDINKLLDGTPFKLAYRAANEALIYLRSAQEFGIGDNASAMDNFTLMKILSRIEGDETKLKITGSESDCKKLTDSGVDAKEAEKHGNLTILTVLREIIKEHLGEFSTGEEQPTENENTEANGETPTNTPETTSKTVMQPHGELRKSIKKIDDMISQLERDHFVSYWN